jgi:D-galactarolactone isomerase
MQATLGLQRVVVVQANGYRFDNAHVLSALAQLGESARGVVVVAPDTPEPELQRLTALGVRGVRLHMLPGGALQWPELPEVAARVRPFGWHVQVQCDGHTLPAHFAALQAVQSLGVDCVIDHLGKFLGDGPPTPDAPAFRALLRLLDGGRCWIKLSGPYESSRRPAPDHDDVLPLARALVASHPERCVWASNWPHPMRDPPPSDAALLDLLGAWADDEATRQRILVDNPARLYGFQRTGPAVASASA